MTKKSPQSNKRRRGGRRHSSASTILNTKETSVNDSVVGDNDHEVKNNESTILTAHHNRHRRRSSSSIHNKQRHQKQNNEQEDDSPAFYSLVDIIGEMRRLPSLSSNSLQYPEKWKRVRRHSEPPQQNQRFAGINSTRTGASLQPIYEQSLPNDEVSNHPHVKLDFPASSFLSFEEQNEDGLEDVLVSPLTIDNQLTKRNRSKSVPNTLKPYEHITTRKPLYPTYLSVSEASALIRSRKLYSGILKIDAQDSSNANVECEALDASIYIFGSRNRNRALNGDEVAVMLVSVDEMLNEKRIKRQVRLTRRLSALSLHATSLSSIPEDHFLEEENIIDFESKPKYCGKVVCILERPKNMLFSGTLSLNRPTPKTLDHGMIRDNNKKEAHHPKIIWFIPADKRLPLVAVPIKFAPSNFIKYHEEYKNRIFIGNIQRWPATSLHPFGTIEKEIGWIGELRVHSGALMADHHIKDIDFPDAVIKATQTVRKGIRHEDRKGRLDLTKDNKHLNIFTFSNDKQQSIDNAFSFRIAEKGIYEVGIHIPDMTKYIRENTPLDHEARERACVVNLVDKTIPILPLDFIESHHSLRIGEERLTFSIICRFTETGQLLHTWIGKTIIKVKEQVKVYEDDITNDAYQLLELCRKLQQRRLNKEGGLVIADKQQTISFQLAESGYPTTIKHTKQRKVDILIQELLILANIEVGQKISSRFPDQALLYRQDAPKMSKLVMIQDYFHHEEGSKDTIKDLLKLTQETELSVEKQQVLNYIIQQAIPSPKFFSAGSLDISKYKHYGFGASICTLFTEPFKSYASIHVQRQLNAVLRGEAQQEDDVNFDTIDKIARHCNASYLSKLAAERESRKLYTEAYIHTQCLSTGGDDDKKKRRMIMTSYIIGLDNDLIQLYIPDYGLEIPIILDEKSIPGAVDHIYDSILNEMKIIWKRYDTTTTSPDEEVQILKFLSPVEISVHIDMKSIRPLFEIELMRS
ncbi:uncharacterized protein BX663DRAFT_7164 [Cokeromyces recurvatus]|uniref:uncharacterized protein n=1 Tax=Cokeromyces recurvatus TaxID=90255 RepID=UPI00221FDA07|nr:uncharacterized protein BX663DRAFT_7164 [Cokeromyces recurvatus]KAI7907659.1 hypothetical protein BX663DRAFT_7164 [Cokeromyces recurvatus]